MNPRRQPLLSALAAATLVLISAAWMRGAEYDEQYTLFLTAGMGRPDWPDDAFPAGDIQRLQAGHVGFAAIAHDLRATDVHPPLYFWSVAAWRTLIGDSLFAARLASVLFSLAALLALREFLCAVVAHAGLRLFPHRMFIARGVSLLIVVGHGLAPFCRRFRLRGGHAWNGGRASGLDTS